jgi:hypothetical protein
MVVTSETMTAAFRFFADLLFRKRNVKNLGSDT